MHRNNKCTRPQGVHTPSSSKLLCRNDRAGFRTQDLRIKSPLLCQLSYPVLWVVNIITTVCKTNGLWMLSMA